MPAPPRPLLPLWARFMVWCREHLPVSMTASYIVPALDSFGISDGEPKALAHHPLARERITSYLLKDDDADLWLLTRLIRSIEWELLLCNYPTATAMMESLLNRIPILISSPSYHYLWARMLGQQGYLDRAAFHRRKAFECFLPYTHDWLRISEESTVLKYLTQLDRMRGDLNERPSKEFLTFLGHAYDGFVKMRHPKDIGFFHCDLFHLFLEYQYLMLDERATPGVLHDQNSHVISVVGWQIQHGNFFGCYTLFRWILKNVSVRFGLETVVSQLKDIFSTHTPGTVLVEKILGEIFFASAKNILTVANNKGQVTRHVVDHIWDLLERASFHAYRAGDELLITDINWIIFVTDHDVYIQSQRKRFRKHGGTKFWTSYENMFNDFREFWKFYASRDDAKRIGRILDQFEPILNLCRWEGYVAKLDAAWAYYFIVTGDKRGEHPYIAAATSALRKLDLVNAVKAMDAMDENYPELPYSVVFQIMEAKLWAYQRLGKLNEGIPLVENLIDLAWECNDYEHDWIAVYHSLFFKADLAHTLAPAKREAFVFKLQGELLREVKWGLKVAPTDNLTFKKAAMAAMFLVDNWRYLRDKNALLEVYKNVDRLVEWHSTWDFKRFFDKQTRYQVEFYTCVTNYLAGYREDAFYHARQMALIVAPLKGVPIPRGKTMAERQNSQLFMDWMSLFIAMYVDVIENLSYGGRSYHITLTDDLTHEEFWKAVRGVIKYADETGDWERLSMTYYHLGWFMELYNRLDEAMDYYSISLDCKRDFELYGVLPVKRAHLVPEFMREVRVAGIIERISIVSLKLEVRDRELLKAKERVKALYAKIKGRVEMKRRAKEERKEQWIAEKKEKFKGFFWFWKKNKMGDEEDGRKDGDGKKEEDGKKKEDGAGLQGRNPENGGHDKKKEEEPFDGKKKKVHFETEDVSENDENKENRNPNARVPRNQNARQPQIQNVGETQDPLQETPLQVPKEDTQKKKRRRKKGKKKDEDKEKSKDKSKGKRKVKSKGKRKDKQKKTEEERRREEIREGKKPMTGGRAQPMAAIKPRPPKAAPAKAKPQEKSKKKKSKVPKPPEHYSAEASYDLWETVQILKGWNYRQALGAGTLWDDQANLLNEFNKVIAYSSPAIESGAISWTRELEKIIRPGGGHGDWSMAGEFLLHQIKEIGQLEVALEALYKSDRRISMPTSIITANPPVMQDVYDLRQYRTPGQAIILVDYVALEDHIYMIYNVEKFAQVKYFPQPACRCYYVRLRETRQAVEAWTEAVSYRGLHGEDITDLLDVGRGLVAPIMRIARRGDLVIIGNSPLTNRIPFHAIPVGKDVGGPVFSHFEEPKASNEDKDREVGPEGQVVEEEEDLPLPEIVYDEGSGLIVTLGNYFDVVYSFNLLVTKQCLHRLVHFENRPMIPYGMTRASFCYVPGQGTSSASETATREALRRLTKKFRGDHLALYDDRSSMSGAELRQAAMTTFDFLHFQGEISMEPDADKPENATLRVTAETTLSARDIARDLQFQLGCCPLVTCIGEQPDHLPKKARVSDLPDGVSAAFLHAGASSVITTLWPVPSQVANRFAKLFYGNFLKRGRLDGDQVWNVALELRVVTDTLRKEFGNENSHWASFVLNGSWMRGVRPGGRIVVEKEKVVKSDWRDYMQPDKRDQPPPEFMPDASVEV